MAPRDARPNGHDPDMAYWEGISSEIGDLAPDTELRPTVRVTAGAVDKLSTEAERVLMLSCQPIYQRGHTLVRPVCTVVPASRGRTTLAAGLADISPVAMVDRMARAACWQKYDGRNKSWRPTDPPEKVAHIILSRVGEWSFPAIAGVITTPTLRADGSLLTAPGYDPATRLYHFADPNTDILQKIPTNPTKSHAEAALAELQYILKNFPFVSETDHAVGLSALLTPIARGAIPVAPMHAFRASTAGTGKTYLIDVVSALATARPCPVATVAKTEEETEKRLGGLLLAAFPLICLDNVNGELGGDLLCQAIERPLVQIRPLGASTIAEVETRATVFATGNALRVRGDMTRRTLIANLDAGVERPELRSFDFDPVEVVLADRARYVGAALTILLAHAEARYPGADNISPLASFTDWSRIVRAALVWLGCADPCPSMDEARDDDPDLLDLKELLDAWKQEIGTLECLTTADLVSRISDKQYTDHDAPYTCSRLRDFVLRVANRRGMVDSKLLGMFLRAKSGRIINGLSLVTQSRAHGGSPKWQLKEK